MVDTDDRVLLEIAELARRRFGWRGPIDRRTRLIEDLGLDSMKALEMLVEVENHFRIRVDEATEEEIVTVGDLVRLIEADQAAAVRGKR